MIQHVAILGGGSAGFIAAMTLKKKLPGLSITVVRSQEIGVIGVGESTTVAIPNHLHGYLDIDPGEFHRRVMPSFKLGIRFLWGPRPFFDYTFGLQMDWKWEKLSRTNGYYCYDDFEFIDLQSSLMSFNKCFLKKPNGDPLITRNFGYHIDNRRFVSYIESKAGEMGIQIIDDIIEGANTDQNGITAIHLNSGKMITADLYIDCTGFKSLLLGKALAEPFISFKSTLFCDRAVTGSWKRTEEVILPFTVAETMTTGWCWQIDHPDSIMRGYVYSSDFINDEDAEREFRKKNPNVSDTRVVKFVSGRYNRSWVKNVVAIGNASGFVEPLESTALAIICDESRILAECLSECENQPTPSLIHQYNRINSNAWDIIRDFLGIHYKFNTRYENPFWKSCQNDTKLGKVQELVDYYRENGPSTFARTSLLDPNNIFGMEGYLSLLIGQKVSYQKQYVPTMDEKNIWDLIRKENQTLALSGYGVRETIDIITGPNWYWTPGYFKDRANPSLSSIDLTSYIGEK